LDSLNDKVRLARRTILPVDESEEAALTTSGHVKPSYRKTYPQSSKTVGRARREVVDFARACGFRGQLLDEIEVAVGEGLANAVEHGHRDEGVLEVWVRRSADALIVEIKDNGRGFDHGTVCSHAAGPPIEALRGFGTFIMREVMDDVQYSDFGTRLRLMKRLPTFKTSERSALRA
jgi:anti-sigma regulatory factor (Ser/Thr protein kinase)